MKQQNMPQKDIKYLLDTIVDLYCTTGVWETGIQYGASKIEIQEFEELVGKKFSEGLKSYFAYFGKAPGLGGMYSFSFKNILSAIREAEEDEDYLEYKRDGYVPIQTGDQIDQEPIANTCLVNHVDYNGHYFLIKLDEYNPILFSSFGIDEGFGGHKNISLTHFLRQCVHLDFSLLLGVKKDLKNEIAIPEYLKDYVAVAKRLTLNGNEFLGKLTSSSRDSHRREFEEYIQNKELATNVIYSFSEMEKEYHEKNP